MSDRPLYTPPEFTNGYEFTQGSGYNLPQYPFVAPAELLNGEVKRVPLVIVGAGITGLTLACSLGQLGVEAVLLDEDDTVGVKGASSRGICYTQKSLEIFEKLGIYPRIATKGIQWSVGRTFAGDDEVYSFDLRTQSQFGLSSQPPFINIQQFYIEGYLVERILAQKRIDLRWKSRVTGFEQNQGYATLQVQTPQGAYRLQADHVVDASGSNTPFHSWCQARMTSKRGDDRWCIADVRFRHHPPKERHTWIEAPFNGNRAVWQHLMADDVWRIDYQMEPNADAQQVSREDVVLDRLRAQFGKDVDCEIVWVGPYAYRSQCLEQLRIGSVFFMGDTAKIVSPFGARGGNTGVADADNLAWKLAAVLGGQAPETLLESYHAERHEAAVQNVLVTNRTARFLRPADGIERTFRTAAIALAKKYAFARPLINTGRMAVANSYTVSGICQSSGGLSVQNVSFCFSDGSPAQLNDLLRWAGAKLLLLAFGDLSKNACQRLQNLTQTAPVLCVQVLGSQGRAQAKEHVLDRLGHLQGACHVFGHAWALVRPDSYLCATGESIDAGLDRSIQHALAMTNQEIT